MHADQAAVAEARQPASLLALGAVHPDRHDARQQVRAEREDEAAVLAGIAERFERNRNRQAVETAAAVLLRDRHSLQTDLTTLAPEIARESLLAIAAGDVLVENLAGELDDVRLQVPLVVAERE